MQHNRDVVKDVLNALQLEQDLQLSQAQHGVAVLDIYSSEWGSSKALSETFRRLYTDAGDQIHLRFLSVECNSVIESLNHPDEQRNPKRPKNLEMCRETLPTFWKDILVSRRGKSKSYFVFYKEGTKRAFIEGVNTPKIISYVKYLCQAQKPANECTSNQELLAFWEYYFSMVESEVFWESFAFAMLDYTAAKHPLTDREENLLADAIGVQNQKVTIEAIEKWVGEGRTLKEAYVDLFPFLKEDSGVPVPANAKTEEVDPKETSEMNMRESFKVLKDNKLEQRPELWRHVAATPLCDPSRKRLVLLSSEDGENEATALLHSVANIPTLNLYLTDWGVPADSIQTMCHAATEKIPSNFLAYGKLALILMLCDSSSFERLVGREESPLDQLADDTLLTNHLPLAYTVICLCASETQNDEILFWSGDKSTIERIETFEVDHQAVLPPFSRLCLNAPPDGIFTVRVVGTPKVIRIPPTEDCSDVVVLSPWFAKFSVTEKTESSITLTFVENVHEKDFQESAQSYTERLLVDEERLSILTDMEHIEEFFLASVNEATLPSIDDERFTCEQVTGAADDVAGEDVAGEDVAGEDVAEEDVAGEDVAEEDVAEEDVAEEDVAGEDVAGEDVAGEDVAEEDVAEEDVAEEDVAGEDVAGEDVAGEDVAEEDVAGEDVAEEDVAEEDVAEEDVAEEDVAGEDVAEEDVAVAADDVAEEDVAVAADDVAEEDVAVAADDVAEEDVAVAADDVTEEDVAEEDVAVAADDVAGEDVAVAADDVAEEDVAVAADDVAEEDVAVAADDVAEEDVAVAADDVAEEDVAVAADDVAEEDVAVAADDVTEEDVAVTAEIT